MSTHRGVGVSTEPDDVGVGRPAVCVTGDCARRCRAKLLVMENDEFGEIGRGARLNDMPLSPQTAYNLQQTLLPSSLRLNASILFPGVPFAFFG